MTLKSLKKVYQGKFLTYYIANFEMTNGGIKDYELVSRDPHLTLEKFGKNKCAGVGMVTFNVDKSKILLQKEFRPATNRWVYNFPAGLIDEGETALEAAIREVREETGLKVVKVEAVLPPSYASQGTSDELMQIVICECVGEISGSIYAEEEIKPAWYTKDDIKKLLEEGAPMSVRTQMFLWQWSNQ